MFRPGENRSDLDSAFKYLGQAAQLSAQLHLPDRKNKVLISIATCYVEAGDLESGIVKFKEAIAYYKKVGNKRAEAGAWYSYGSQLKNNNKNDHQRQQLACFESSYKLYKEGGDTKEAIQALVRWTQIQLDRKNNTEAENGLQRIRNECIKIGYFKEFYGWALDNLTTIAASKGDFYEQLFYQLENLDALKKHAEYYTDDGIILAYNRITGLYLALGDYIKAELYAQKELSLTLKRKGDYVFPLDNLFISMLHQGNAEAALRILKKTIKIQPPERPQQVDVDQFFGRIYAAMHRYELADHHFKKAVAEYDALDPRHENINLFTAIYETASDFYISTGQFKKADHFVKGLAAMDKHFTRLQKSELALKQSKVDSASGDHFSALVHFHNYSNIKDSIFNSEKISQLNRLEVVYETKQKQIKINLLNAQNKAHLAETEKANLERNITAGGIVVMFIITGITFYSFRIKIKSNRLLTFKSLEIDRQNKSLQVLVNEKERLLAEKEDLLADKDILLKEVHHRVKNNLQIVMSLLSTQLEYLENKEAVQALEESHQRVQAIALVHQKLYRDKGGIRIEMRPYIADMVDDLDGFFNAGKRKIRFELEIDPIHLDIEQAVPVGLILNEAMTNSIKYAFTNDEGSVKVFVKRTLEEHVVIKITDNGKGLPTDFDLGDSNTLGMEMMKGLSKQLSGTFNIVSNAGVEILLSFPYRDKRIFV
ncbi:hypothetical protein GCM10023149_15870 [Mucilaginibacter gynuensis]|uniref:histidine kinase n=1 Tax=Mucilaginibacter gynuensis TaxID=1302236 RepID=A0ABP8G5R9_9SPHI